MAQPFRFLSRASPERRALALALSLGLRTAWAATTPAADAPAELRSGSFSPADLDRATLAASAVETPGESVVYLDVFRGGRATGQLLPAVDRAGRVFATPRALSDIGLLLPDSLATPADGLLALDAIPGLVSRYDRAQQTLTLDVASALRPEQVLGETAPGVVHTTRSFGAALDYTGYARWQGSEQQYSLALDARTFGRFGTFEMLGVLTSSNNSYDFNRLDARWTYSDPVHLWTWTAGDFVSGGLNWTRPVRMQGLQWRRNFGVRPDLVTFPIPHFAGDAAVPSAVDLLVNNVRQFSGQVDDGPFVVNTFPRINGAGTATLVVRDALGRVTETSVQIYADTSRLARGLTDFSLEAGRLHTNFGGTGSRNAEDWAGSASVRHGITDDFTLEAHAESSSGLQLGGLGGIWSPGGLYGVFNAALAWRTGEGSGQQETLGYQWFGPRFGLDMQAVRRQGSFRDIGDVRTRAGNDLRRRDQVGAFYNAGLNQLGLTWLRWKQDDELENRTIAASWSRTFGHFISVTANAFDDNITGHGVGISLSIPLGHDLDVSLDVENHHGQTDTVASLRRNAPYEGGWGWEVQAGHASDNFASATANHRGHWADLWLGAERRGDREGAFAQVTGSLVAMDGALFASHPISDAFAVVDAGQPDVPILYENRVYGRTDAHGRLLVSDLRGWQRNRLAIDPDQLGAMMQVGPIEQFVTPPDRGAALVRFDVHPVRPAWLTLLGPSDAPVPAGTEARVQPGRQSLLVGLDGQAWLEDRPAGVTVELEVMGKLCRYHIPAPGAGPATIERIGPLKCEP